MPRISLTPEQIEHLIKTGVLMPSSIQKQGQWINVKKLYQIFSVNRAVKSNEILWKGVLISFLTVIADKIARFFGNS